MKGLKTFQCTRQICGGALSRFILKPFFKDLVDYIISGPVVCMIWQGPTGTVAAARKMIGETNPLESLPGSIRKTASRLAEILSRFRLGRIRRERNQLMVCGW